DRDERGEERRDATKPSAYLLDDGRGGVAADDEFTVASRGADYEPDVVNSSAGGESEADEEDEEEYETASESEAGEEDEDEYDSANDSAYTSEDDDDGNESEEIDSGADY
ncbi:hypothetical protein THAOC_14796, partial [Thalassiosira oceanica]